MALGRTNCFIMKADGSGGSGVTTVDLPTCPASIAANGGNTCATITLTYTDTDYISGVEVRYKTGGYPTNPTDGNGVTAEGAAASIEISGLTNGTKYYFRVFLYREVDGVKYYQTDLTNAKAEVMPRAVVIEGVTPAEAGVNYFVIDQSCEFTLSAPAGTRIILGNGGDGGTGSCSSGSHYNKGTAGSSGGTSTLKIGDTTYDAGTSREIIPTAAGDVGGGGAGGEGSTGGGEGGNGTQGGNGGLPNGSGGDGGKGATGHHYYYENGSEHTYPGGDGGKGGASGNGTQGSAGGKGSSTSPYTGGEGGKGAVGDTPGRWCYGGTGGKGARMYFSGSSYGYGGNGGNGGYVAKYHLEHTENATCVLIIGTGGGGGAGGKAGSYSADVSGNAGLSGGSGVLIIEWDTAEGA